MFILCFKILFIVIKNNHIIKWTEIFEYGYLYTAYANNLTFYWKDKKPNIYNLEKFKVLFDFLRLKQNATQFEIVEKRKLNVFQETVCGIRCIDLRNEVINMLVICFS